MFYPGSGNIENPEPPPRFPDPRKFGSFEDYTTHCFGWEEKNENLYYYILPTSLSAFYRRPKLLTKKNSYSTSLPDAEETKELYQYILSAYREQVVPEEVQKWVYDADTWPAWMIPQIPEPEIEDTYSIFEIHITDWADTIQKEIKQQEEIFKRSTLVPHKSGSFLTHGNQDSVSYPQHFRFLSPHDIGKILKLSKFQIKKPIKEINYKYSEQNKFYERISLKESCFCNGEKIKNLFFSYKTNFFESCVFCITTEIYSMLQYGCNGRINHSLIALPAEKTIFPQYKLRQMLDLSKYYSIELVGHAISCISGNDQILANPRFLHELLSHVHTFMHIKTKFCGNCLNKVFALPNSPLKQVFLTLLYYFDMVTLLDISDFINHGKYCNNMKKNFRRLDSLIKDTVKKEFEPLTAQIKSLDYIDDGEATAIIGILQMATKIPSAYHVVTSNLTSVRILSKIPLSMYSEYALTIIENPSLCSIMLSSISELYKYNIQLLDDNIIQRTVIFMKIKPTPELKRNFNENEWVTYAISSLLGVGSRRSVYLALSIIRFSSNGCHVFKPRSWELISAHLLGLFVSYTEVHKDVDILANELKAIRILSHEEINARFLMEPKTALRFLRFTKDENPEITRAAFKLMAHLAVKHTKQFLLSVSDPDVRSSVIDGIRSISVPDSFELIQMLTRLIIKYIPSDPRKKESRGSLMKVVQSGPEIVAVLGLLREADWTVKTALDRIKTYHNRSLLFPLNCKIADFLEQLKTRSSSTKLILNGFSG